MAEPIAMPRLGWTMEEGTLVEWLKADGDTVEPGEILFTVESDKALNEIETFSGGILRIPPDAPRPGDTVPVGTLLGYLLQPGEEMPTAPPPTPAAEPVPTPAEPAAPVAKPKLAPTSAPVRSGGPTISPRARRVASELGVEWRALTGSGRTGRIVERDVRAAAARSGQAVPAILTTEADATELVTLRPQLKLEGAPAPAYHHLIAKLVVVALAEHPQLNASETEAVHLSLAVDTGEDLATPVIRDAHTKTWAELAVAARALALQVRRALEPEATQGGTFAIANFGMYGIDAFTPILRPPYRATLGLGRIAERPAVHEGRVVPRALISLSLTVESGLLENGAAVRFLDRVRTLIERPELGLQD